MLVVVAMISGLSHSLPKYQGQDNGKNLTVHYPRRLLSTFVNEPWG